ncbi:MAG: sigma-70 family RNA polymerase sigma factor [Planctomycetota bacterium]
MHIENSQTSMLLNQWHAGDPAGLQGLLEAHLPWLRSYAHTRLGHVLRSKAETQDYVQDAVLEFLLYAPRVHISDKDHFRALLVRILENVMCSKYDWFTAKRRWVAKERPIPSDTVLRLDPPEGGTKTPSRALQQSEEEAWVRLGLELLDSGGRELLILRQWEKMSFAQIGRQLGITEDAARMRHNSAMGRLGEKIWLLREGRLPQALEKDSA